MWRKRGTKLAIRIKLGRDLNLAPGYSGYVDTFLQVGDHFSHCD